jgi:peptidoglycan/LPS O-acetylase OafA/YrhL
MPYRPLGTMRLFLSALVMMQHYLQYCFHGPLEPIVMPYEPGGTAVFVFFVLSGFVVTEAADFIYRGRPIAFGVNRALRIFPLYIVTILLCFAAIAIRAPNSDLLTTHNLVANLFAIVPLPGRFRIEASFPVLPIAWALYVELAFYAAVAPLLIGHRKFRAVFLIASVSLLALSAWGAVAHPPLNPLVSMAPFFILGGAYYLAISGSLVALPVVVVAAGLSVVAMANLWILFVCLTAASMLLCISTVQYNDVDRALGDFSYPVYLGHWIPMWFLPPEPDMAIKMAALCAGIACPVLLWLTIEPITSRARTAVRGVTLRTLDRPI